MAPLLECIGQWPPAQQAQPIKAQQELEDGIRRPVTAGNSTIRREINSKHAWRRRILPF